MRAAMGMLLIGAWLGLAGTASAQYPSKFDRRPVRADRRPLVSPYLDLLNGSRSFEESYFRRMSPELEFRRANDQLYRSTAAMQREIQALQSESGLGEGLGATGHSTSFMNYGGYYNVGGRSGGAALSGGGGAGLGGGGGSQGKSVLNGARGSNLPQSSSQSSNRGSNSSTSSGR